MGVFPIRYERCLSSAATILDLDSRGQRVGHPAEGPGALDQHVERVVVQRGRALDDEPGVAQLPAGALGAHGHGEPGDVERPLARDVADGEAEAARERPAEQLGRHEPLVLAAVVGRLVDRDRVAARLHVRAKAAAEGRSDLEPLGHQRPRPARKPRYSRSWTSATRAHVCRATTARPPARNRSAGSASRATRTGAAAGAGASPAGASSALAPWPRKPRKTSGSETTAGRPAASASSTASP